jgi:head-tail adaptor
MINSLYQHTATIYTVSEGISSLTGENTKTNTLLGTVKCRVRPLSVREQFYQNKNNLETTHRMYCDYSTSFDNVSRVVHGTSTFEIIGIVNPFGQNEFLQVDMKYVS